ncbi:actin-like protein 6B [Drosophila guanche]|uniref:Blast:Actin-like protein 6B n=1 Tax=Drosophila guanche TaxID=7266 RepID=A0A3B0JMZ2_DROGU|nr:actin-like protein 6B [Drosophila guanche]SPP74686.1 blast:Actin-like protein 6B [Drosophila guanche]
MSGGNMLYGGDEIGALVFDPGHHSLRVGYAQEDSPKAEIPSVVGIGASPTPETNLDPETKTDNNVTPNNADSRKYYVDTNYVNVPRSQMEVQTYMKDGMIDNWDLFEKVIDYAYANVIQSEPEYHPVLFSEASWNVRNNREKLTELMFEKYNVPAFFLVKNAVLAAFSSGRATALVVDSGATHTSAVPVHEGYVLSQAVVKSPLGGDFLSRQCRQHLDKLNIDLSPVYKIASKDVVKERDIARFTLRKLPENLTQSWQNYMVQLLMQDFQMNILQVLENPFDERVAAQIPTVHYEFPNGYHQDFGSERFKIAETLFDNALLGAGQLASTSVGMCDADVRLSLFGSVVVTGGNTLLQGFPERLNRDLQLRAPSNTRLKMISANGSVERRFGAWIGGSILASIGTFQQMWISSQEYEEAGKSQVERKCP